MYRSLRLVGLVSFALCLPSVAQKATGVIRGNVTDPSGAMVAGAQVTVASPSTGQSRTATTNEEGGYVVPELQPGIYEVRLKHPNFKEYVGKNVEVFVSSTTVVNVALEVGSTTEMITVEAQEVQVETTTGAVGNVVEGREVRELPLNGRSFVQLTQLMPGVSPQAAFDSKNKGLMAGVDFSVNGNNTTGNVFNVDGVNNNDVGSNRTILVYPSIDSIQEFKILRNSYGPEYGQAMGAIVNLVTRSGTNAFHGGAYYFGRNDALNATDYFNSLNGIPKDTLRRNDWGYTIGGPIVKDKLFFFWSEEWNRELRGGARSANVPTEAERQGDFSQLRVASDGSPCENTPEIGGVPVTSVPANERSAAGALLVQLFPLPNIPQAAVNPDLCNNWAESLTSPIYWREESIRADYNIGTKWKIMGRYTHDSWSQPYPSTLGFWGDDRYPSVESSWIQPGEQATIKVSRLFGGNAVNDFQVSYAANRITAKRAGTNPGLNNQITQALPPDYPLSGKESGANLGYPIFWGGLGNGAESDDLWTQAPWHNNEQLLILKDDFSQVFRNHTFKFGVLFSNNQKNELFNGSSGEAPNFGGITTTPADGVTGPDSTNGTFNALWSAVWWNASELQTNPFGQQRWHDLEFYFGDTWKIRRNISFEYGVRWSLLRQPYLADDKGASFQPSAYDPALGNDPCNGMFIAPGSDFCKAAGFLGGTFGPNRALKKNNNHAFAPRLGIAWDPHNNGKMSIRAGVGQFFQRERLFNGLAMANNPPFSLLAPSINRHLDIPVPQTGGTGAPSFGVDPGDSMPNTWQWNLTVEREIFRDSKIEVAYVGNRGVHLLRFNDANFVNPSRWLDYSLSDGPDNGLRPYGAGDFGQIDYAEWKGGSNYHALQALYRVRVKAVDAQFAYTFSKSLSDTSLTTSGGSQNSTALLDPLNPRLNYGPSYINRPHTLVGNIVYTAPDFVGQNTFVRHGLGGWELAAILDYSSGPSLTVFANGEVTGAAGGFTGTGARQDAARPNRVPGQGCRAPSGSPKFQWLNQSAWTVDNYQLTTFGTAGVGQCLGPGIANTDFSIHKNFKLGDRVKLQFRMEFFNIFNKVQFRSNSEDITGVDNNLISSAVSCNGSADPVCAGHAPNTVGWNFAELGNPTFGQVQHDKGPREIQYSLKIEF